MEQDGAVERHILQMGNKMSSRGSMSSQRQSRRSSFDPALNQIVLPSDRIDANGSRTAASGFHRQKAT